MMKKHLKFRSLVSITLITALLFTVVSCDKEKIDERPDLPPLESLVMDFDDFSQPPPGGLKGTEATYVHFGHAYVTVAAFNLLATLTMALPVTAYTVALQQEPVYVGDHTWEWAFDFPLNQVNYTATLTGTRLNNDEFSMEMVIALAALPEQGVKWFDGVVMYNHTHAVWNLYEEGTTKVLEVEWHKNYETEAGDLTYTYVKPEQEETGSYIMWEYMPGEAYDASYEVSLSTGLTDIEWNTTTIEGRVMDEVKFGDTSWHCWDSLANGLVDKVCD